MYPQGYFHQHINPDGWQEEVRNELNFDEAPITHMLSPEGKRSIVQVPMGERTLHIGVWLVRVGSVRLYLMNADVEENPIEDRQCANCLYVSDRELRIQQEIILGIGGVRVLKVLGIKPSVWHANEGHTAFMMIERVRQKMEEGMTFDEASRSVRESTVFTTHTPVPSGHDVFSAQLVEKYLGGYLSSFGIGMESFLGLGRADSADNQSFNMTAFALHMAAHRNAVSELHGQVTRKMWHTMWPDLQENKVPILHVTNGIHVPTWVSREFDQLFDNYMGKDWLQRRDDSDVWEGILNIPDKEFWEVRQLLKNKLIDNILERAQRNWADGKMTAQQILTSGVLLHPKVFTIGFARRFTAYKRATLLYYDLERLKALVRDRWRPVQIVFAGKSHPDDHPSKQLLRQVYEVASSPDCLGRIVFIEDYDIHIAHYLTQGVDVWLNTPRRLNEACGTSGMKASMNGVPHLSVRDGWWHEGYNGKNGWAIGSGPEMAYSDEEDKTDAEALYRLLEEQIVPMYYDRDRSGLPLKWIAIAKEAMRTTVSSFCARRMMKEYIEKMYSIALKPSNA
jgi:starch phosphorylase